MKLSVTCNIIRICMPKPSFIPQPCSNPQKVKAIDLSNNLYWPFFPAILLSSAFAFLTSLPYQISSNSLQISVFMAFFLFTIILSLAVVTYVLFRAKQRYLCALFLKSIVCDHFYKHVFFTILKYHYSILGKYTEREDVAGFCYVFAEYQENIGQGKRGMIAERVEAISNFFPDETSYATKRRMFLTLVEEGRELISGT